MTDGGLSPGTRAWLTAAGQRLNEPVRGDSREDVRTQLAGGELARAGVALQALLERLVAAIPAGCPSDPCPICSTLEDLQALARSLQG